MYSGPGGLGTGFEKYFHVSIAVDHDKDAATTYHFNHAETDVRMMEVKTFIESMQWHDYDGIIGYIGGPPCQEYTRLNKHKDEGNDRAIQIYVMCDAILSIHPKFALIENVSTVPKRIKDEIVSRLESRGYNVVAKTVRALDYGSVQIRRRWVLTAHVSRHVFPEPKPGFRTAREILTDEISEIQPTPKILEAIQNIPSGHWTNLPGQIYKSYFIIEPDKPLPAVVNPTKLRYVKPDRSGYLSMAELIHAQGFPSGYQFFGNLSSIGQQLANAVPVELGESFAKAFAERES